MSLLGPNHFKFYEEGADGEVEIPVGRESDDDVEILPNDWFSKGSFQNEQTRIEVKYCPTVRLSRMFLKFLLAH